MQSKVLHDSETPAHGLQVITACAFLYKDFDGVTKVFLPKRSDKKKFLPSVYEIPGGHINFGEDIVTGLKREIKEELGVEIQVGDVFEVFTYINEIKGSHSVEIIYFAQFFNDIKNITLNPEDHSEYVWFAEDELHKVISQNKRGDDPEIQALKKGFTILRRTSKS